ncbi:MAG TPA: DUF732 domain-containing protein [Mycobacterium sp.]|uniref:DUF732 domain-containing protein n=1 Tax=Mycobacterium sp. TaxID=1785 RepID=UPI002BC30A4C|nr:DUF732 domain-containing protein [Mycobacterium sp.]HME76572.1 DUF732 domain-containing protein [Mycobacterium sp.]
MKPLLAVVGVSLGLVLGVPAQADPGIDEAPSNDSNGVFLADLQKVGIGYSDPNQATSAGQAVCACIHNGMSGLHLLKHLQENNPALTENGAAQFATISAKSYCPRQLDETDEPGGSKARTGGGGKGGGD